MKVYRFKRQLDGSVNEKLGLSKRYETVGARQRQRWCMHISAAAVASLSGSHAT